MTATRAADHNNFTPLRLGLALLVLLGHFKILSGHVGPGDPGPGFPFNCADLAVDAFFVVSGYLITASFDAAPDLRRFYIRRVCRLYPLYLCIVLLQAAVMLALLPGGPAAHAASGLRYLVVNAAFLNFLQYDIGGFMAGQLNPSLNPSLWTLKIEMGFYLVLPLLWLAVRRWGAWLIVAIFLAATVYRVVLDQQGMLALGRQLPGQMQYFAVGMGLHAWRGRLACSRRVGLLVLGLATAVLVFTLRTRLPVVYPLAVGAGVFAVALRLPPLRPIRDVSYGVYLIHAPVIQLSLVLGAFADSWAALGATIVGVLLLAIVAERLVERPGIALGRRLSAASSGLALQPSP